MMEMRLLRSYSKPEEAYLAASYLEAHDVRCNVRDGHTASVDWLYSQAIGGVKLEVHAEDYARAAELLDLPAAQGDLRCPRCGSDRVRLRQLSPWAVLSFVLAGFIVPVRSRKADCLECRIGLTVVERKNGEVEVR